MVFHILDLSVISNHFIDSFSRYLLSSYSYIFRAGVKTDEDGQNPCPSGLGEEADAE